VTLCLLHGKWHGPSSWGDVPDLLRERGHVVLVPDLPFDDPGVDYGERARPAVDAIAAAAEPVVVVGHSLGAIYAPIVAASRPGTRLVYLCPAPGGPLARRHPAGLGPARPGFPFPAEDERGVGVWDRGTALEAMYPRLPPDVAERALADLRPGARQPSEYPLPELPPVPTVLVYARHDEFFKPEWERFLAAELGIDAIELPTGHFPMLEAPDALADLLDELAR
jgi:pimeloyl-ACP methyl ester carboxylesterase